ncbi:MAG: M23 family metallopeptidase [Acidobacteriota bacterium]|nr:MAG: M23 family metallopeptidase [Acidobacteriota bacterium]
MIERLRLAAQSKVFSLLAAAYLGAAVPPAAAPAAGGPELSISFRARALTAGEPVRVVVEAPMPLSRLEARWLDQDVFMVREPVMLPSEAERWTGWGLIPLDQRAGETLLEVEGIDLAGQLVRAALALAIVPKEFPIEHLSVASRYVEPPREVAERLAREREQLRELYARRTPRTVSDQPFVRPVAGEATSVFGTRRFFNDQPRSPHPGLDLRAATGTPVKASGAGIVVLAGDLYYSGKTVLIDHGGGLFTIYAHLSAIEVEEGGEVEAGDRIALSGATGRVTGPHLHWGAKIGERPCDPRALLDPAVFAD